MARSPHIRRPRPPVRRATAARSTVALTAENLDRRPPGQGMARDMARPPGLAPVAPPAPEAQTDAKENAVTERIGPLATGAADSAMGDTTAEVAGAITGVILEEGVADLAGAPEETEVSETGAAQAADDTGAVTIDAVAVEVDESTEAPTPEGMPAEGEAAVTEGGAETSEEPVPEPSPAAAVGPATRAVAKRATASASHRPEATATGGAMASSNRPAVTQRRAASAAGAAMADEAETGEVNRQSFRSQLREAIDKAMKPPESEREAKRLMDEGGKDAARDVQGALGGHTAEATGALTAAVDESAQPSPESMDGGEEVALEPEAIGEPPAPVSAAPVVAPPSTPQAVDMSGNREDADALAAENNITETQLERGNEPEFDATLGARSEAEAHSEEGPAQLREAEAADRAGQRETASGAIATELSDFHAERATRLTNVATQQTETSGLSATRRSEITAELEAIGSRTRADVTDILTKMNDKVVEDFEQAITEALSDYNEVFEDVRGGFLSQLFDFGDVKFERALRAGRAAFQSRIDRAIDEIATYVEGELARARLRVEEGRTEIDRYINEDLPEDEREFAEDASTSITVDFDALEGEIESSRDALVQRMVTMYRDGVERRNAREEELRLANRSLWERVYDATVGVIQKVIEFKNMLLGILARAAAVVEAIIQDPIQFLSNLIAGIKAGLERFMGNIVENLKQALMSWLFGAIEGAGIQLPDTFDLKGFLSIVLQVLGLTKENVRARAVNILGEEMVSRIETGVEMIRILFTEGPAGLWQMLLEKLGDIKETILTEVRSWVISQIIEAGIKWILGLLNPAGAFVKACMMIYDIVVFFIERGQQIIEAVNAIIKALGTIVAGNISAMAQAVEGALNRILPVVIGFLASLLGLGGISDAIRGFIEKVQRPVNKVIDWVINKGVALARGIKGLLGGAQQEEEAEEEPDDPEKAARVQAAMLAIDQEEARQTDEGGVTEEEAETLANRIRADHPVIQGIRVEQHGQRWRYYYRASAERFHDGEQEAQTQITDEWFRENRLEIFNRIHELARTRYRGSQRPQQADFVEDMSGLTPGDVVDLEVGGHDRRARGFGGAGNVLVGERRGEISVSGHSYGELGSRLSEAETTSEEVASGVAAAMRGEAVEVADIADVAAITMGAETARSRGQRQGGGMSEVTTRLAMAGLASGELGVEETFGSRDDNDGFREATRERRATAASSRERFTAGEITAQEARSERAQASRSARAARRRTGGLLPETMVGFAGARRAGRRMADPERRDPGGQGGIDADEIINRTVELVYRIVSGPNKTYDTVDEVMEEIERVLDDVDDEFTT